MWISLRDRSKNGVIKKFSQTPPPPPIVINRHHFSKFCPPPPPNSPPRFSYASHTCIQTRFALRRRPPLKIVINHHHFPPTPPPLDDAIFERSLKSHVNSLGEITSPSWNFSERYFYSRWVHQIFFACFRVNL